MAFKDSTDEKFSDQIGRKQTFTNPIFQPHGAGPVSNLNR